MERALALAGADATLVARPTGVPHVYTGPLTPSGRFAAAAGRTVCRARTRRLTVIPEHERLSSLDPSSPRLCARCSARLSRSVHGTGEPTPRRREEWRSRYAGLSRADVGVDMVLAEDLDEVAAAGHLSLLLFGHRGCAEPFADDTGRPWPPLNRLLAQARGRLATDEQRAAAAVENTRLHEANTQARAEAAAARSDRDARIERLGFRNATAREARRRPPRRPRPRT